MNKGGVRGVNAETEKVMDYARTHLQAVRIVWMERDPEMLSAVDAVVLCSDRLVSGSIVGAVAQDKTLENMLNKIIDGE